MSTSSQLLLPLSEKHWCTSILLVSAIPCPPCLPGGVGSLSTVCYLLTCLVSAATLPHPQGATASRTTAFHCSVDAHVFAAWTYAPAASSHLKLVPGWRLLGPLAPFAAQKRNCFSRTASWAPMPPSPRTQQENVDLLPSFHPVGRPGYFFMTWHSSV